MTKATAVQLSPCRHLLCSRCLRRWAQSRNLCPLDNQIILVRVSQFAFSPVVLFFMCM